jgi:hypothetical protein
MSFLLRVFGKLTHAFAVIAICTANEDRRSVFEITDTGLRTFDYPEVWRFGLGLTISKKIARITGCDHQRNSADGEHAFLGRIGSSSYVLESHRTNVVHSLHRR